MTKQPRSELNVDPVRSMREQVCAQIPRPVSKIAMAARPMTRTSSVLILRCTSTLSITTWKNSGEIRANSWRKSEASKTSPSSLWYLRIAPRNQVMSKRRERSINPARCVMRTRRPSQINSHSSRLSISEPRDRGRWTSTCLSEALPNNRKPPSRRAAIAGKGVCESRDQLVRRARALRPNSFAQRSISGIPIIAPPNRCRI